MLNPAELLTLYKRVMEEAPRHPRTPELVFLFGQTVDNQSSVLDVAKCFDAPIGIDSEDDTISLGYPGFGAWKTELLKRGIPDAKIVGVSGTFTRDGGVLRGNTFTEAGAFVRFAKANNLRTVVIVAPRWHLMRCFMSMVTWVGREYPSLHVYPALGAPQPWDELAVHSQGRSSGTRADFLFQETVRLFQYHEKGDLPSAEDALAYLDSVTRANAPHASA
jgi:hypothetical protein